MSKRRRAASGAVLFMPPTGIKSLDDWVALQRTEAIARIVKAVRKAPNDEMHLATDIFQAYRQTPADLGISEGSKAKSRLKKVEDILKVLERLDALIDSDAFISERINNVSTPLQLSPNKQLLLEAHTLKGELAPLAKKGRSRAELPENLKDRRPSELEWLAGVLLPLVYERHFSLPAKRYRNAEGKPSGPTFQFIDATLRELGIPFRPESVLRAFSRLKPLRDAERTKREKK
jgi:hypothetical protein